MSGRLLVCATPIGNLEDITLRALRVLEAADLIAAEDTRVTRKLLSFYQIKTPMLSYYEHNELRRTPELIDRMRRGATVALVTDAGVPGISDPGYAIINRVIEEGIPIEIVPGPSALISALVLSGLPTENFYFGGWLPRTSRERERTLAEIAALPATLLFYESPHRVEKSLKSIQRVLGERRMALARELTKIHEEVRRGAVSEVVETLKRRPAKGEIVLAIEGAGRRRIEVTDEEIQERLKRELAAGKTKKDAVKRVSEETKAAKRRVYDIARSL